MIFTNIHILSGILVLAIFIASAYCCYQLYVRDTGKKWFLLALFFSVVFLASVLLGPRGGIKPDMSSAEGLRISFVLDVSKSMNVEDIQTGGTYISRLSAAKSLISTLVHTPSNNRSALSVFAGEYLEILPFTDDADVYMTLLGGLDSRNVSVGGTNLSLAIGESIKNFPDDTKKGLVVVLTDGGDEVGTAHVEAHPDISVLVVGVGTEKGGYIPEGVNIFGERQYASYQGKRVVSSLNRSGIQEVVSKVGGEYSEITDTGDMESIVKQILSSEATSLLEIDHTARRDVSWVFFLLSAGSFFVYLLSFVVGKRK